MRFIVSVIIALCMATSLHADDFTKKLNKGLLDGAEKLIEEGVDYMEDSRKKANVSDKATREFIDKVKDIYKNHKSDSSVKAMKKREKEMIKTLEKYLKTMSKNGKEKSGITKEWIEETLDWTKDMLDELD